MERQQQAGRRAALVRRVAQQRVDDAESLKTAGMVLWGVAGAGLIATVVLAVTDRSGGSAASVQPLSVAPIRGGAALTAGFSF